MALDEILLKISANWHKKAGALEASIRNQLPRDLPEDYIEFLKWSNGGEGCIGSEYLSLWNVDEIKILNDGYQIKKYTPELLAIGTDGGGLAYAFDCRHAPMKFVSIPLGDLDYASVNQLNDSFSAWLMELLS